MSCVNTALDRRVPVGALQNEIPARDPAVSTASPIVRAHLTRQLQNRACLFGEEEELEEYKRRAGVADLLDAETSSDDADRSKPIRFLAEISKAKLVPERLLIVGDTPYDAEAERRAGARVIGVLCGGFSGAWLRESGCEAIYRDPADLLDEYDRSPIGLYAGSDERTAG